MNKSTMFSQSGITIVEVLIAAVIFMIGFSLLVALLNSTIVKFSIEELNTAGDIAREHMIRTTALADTTSCDTVVVRSERRFRVVKQVAADGNLAQVLVTVYRQKSEKKLVQFYTETVVPRQH